MCSNQCHWGGGYTNSHDVQSILGVQIEIIVSNYHLPSPPVKLITRDVEFTGITTNSIKKDTPKISPHLVIFRTYQYH